jgi:Na+-transporting methylmalonyl-CoA/oxaloacetate decarboxylase gamma subunit
MSELVYVREKRAVKDPSVIQPTAAKTNPQLLLVIAAEIQYHALLSDGAKRVAIC